MRLIYPPQNDTHLFERGALAGLYAHPNDRQWIRANMVSSLDGRLTLNGRSDPLSNPTDKELFRLLRAQADVIVVGAGTARTEQYGPAKPVEEFLSVRASCGQPETPPIAVVSQSLRLDMTSSLFTDARTIVITSASADPHTLSQVQESADVIVAGSDGVDLTLAMQALADRGHLKVLTEGGPHLLGSFIDADLLDDLCLAVAPRIVGGDGLTLIGAAVDEQIRSLELKSIVEDEGYLFTRYVRAA